MMSKTHAVLLSLCMTVGLVVTEPAYAGSFTYADFASTAGLNLVGSAASAGPIVLLTPQAPGQAGAFWYGTPQVVADGFTTTFTYRIGQPVADGFAFVVQSAPDGSSAIGTAGGGLGYRGIPNSVAVEFDIWDGGPSWEPSAMDHLATQSCGLAPNSTDWTLCGRAWTSNPSLVTALNDGEPHEIAISYAAGFMTVHIAGIDLMGTGIDLSTLLNLGPGGTAFVGFTAGTGEFSALHEIHSWSFESPYTVVPEPASLLLLGTGLAGLARWRKRRQ